MPRSLALLLAGLLLPSATTRADELPSKPADNDRDYRLVKDLPYYSAADADPVKHRLDLYLPKDARNAPVLVFVHGGAWIHGDKEYFGASRVLGAMFARHGVCAVMINYRLSPWVKHPGHVQDVARAVAWTVASIGRYGGDPEQVFLCGHSAGAHLISLLATDERYLKAEKLSFQAIRGVIPISGPFLIPDNLFSEVFGSDAEVRKLAGPLNHVRPGLPPFLIIHGDEDYPTLDQMAADFHKALKEQKNDVRLLVAADRNHLTVMFDMILKDDPVAQAILDFMHHHARPETATRP